MSDTDLQEKRQFVRFEIEAKITFTLSDNDDVFYQGTSQNSCAGGIYITTNHLAKLGEQIKLILPSYDKKKSPSIVEGTVVRSKFDKKNAELFHVSIEFSAPHEQQLQTLSESVIN